ncbi:uncharacterized protein [Haliotis asinina]|uniref:uncharacterized protein n=1 Tax=Haliotis asinina TaxID=109174 RepID=UPI003531BBA8
MIGMRTLLAVLVIVKTLELGAAAQSAEYVDDAGETTSGVLVETTKSTLREGIISETAPLNKVSEETTMISQNLTQHVTDGGPSGPRNAGSATDGTPTQRTGHSTESVGNPTEIVERFNTEHPEDSFRLVTESVLVHTPPPHVIHEIVTPMVTFNHPPEPPQMPSPFDRSATIFPEFLSQIVATESEYCGKTCDFDYEHTRFVERGSCETCRCDEQCVLYDDCCPDYLILRNHTSVPVPYNCENTSPDIAKEDSKWYYMIRSCSVTSAPGLVQDCFDRHSKDWEHQVPVVDAKTGHLYRNKFCALCNNVTVFNNWETQLICKSYPSSLKEARSSEEIYSFALEESICFIKFIPLGVASLRKCSSREESVISSCNVTGKWVFYDRRVVEACERFTHIVHGKYRNVFCYACNTNSGWQFILRQNGPDRVVVDTVSLTTLLNFGRQDAGPRTQRVEQLTDDPCRPDQVLDDFIEACRNVTCSKGKVFNGTACNDVVQATNVYGLEICLHVRVDVPSRLVSKEAVNDLTFTIANMLYGVQWELSRYVWLRTSQQLYHLQNCDSHPRFLIVHIHTLMFSTTPASLEKMMTSLPDILTKHISEKHGNISLTWNQKCAQMILPTLNCFDEAVHDKRIDSAPLTHADAYISSETEYIPWNNQALCPQVHLQPHEFFLQLDGDKQYLTNVLFPNVSLHSPLPLTTVDPYLQEFYVLRINGTDSIFKSEMFLLGDNETAVVCLDDYQTLVKKAPEVTSEYIDLPLGRTSLICTCLSLVFLIITFIFYCAFPTLRTSGGVINMCLVVTLFLTLCVYEFGIEQNENGTVCVIIGIFIHFFWLSVLCWMNACTTHMFLKLSFPLRWRRNESLERTLLFWSLFSILTPVAIVSINIIVHYTLDRELGYGGKICYLNTVPGRIYSFGVPVAVVSLLNIFLFIFTLCKLNRKFEPVQKSSNSKLNMVACVKLSTITGISWLFGYLYELTQTRALAYVFTILVAGQGVFLFLAFIVNKKTLGLVCSKNRGSTKYTSSSNSNNNSNNNNSKSGPPTTQISRL